MKFGLHSVNLHTCGHPDTAARLARAAEAAGFESLWVADHVVLPDPPVPGRPMAPDMRLLDPIVSLTFLAAHTSRIRLGTGVIILPQRQAVVLAKQLASLDVMVRAWTEAPLVHDGKFYRLRLPALRPRPRQQPHPPIWRSASSAGSIREYGRLGAPILMARIPLARVPERLALYETGLDESGLDARRRHELREQAALWRFVHVAESQAQAEDELTTALLETRRHMVHAREANNPPDFYVEASRVNPWNDPRVSHEDGVRYSLKTSTLYGTPQRVAEQVAEVRDAGVRHVLCQISYGYLPHQTIVDSMRRFGELVLPRFR